jgi:hypothetical protein
VPLFGFHTGMRTQQPCALRMTCNFDRKAKHDYRTENLPKSIRARYRKKRTDVMSDVSVEVWIFTALLCWTILSHALLTNTFQRILLRFFQLALASIALGWLVRLVI